MATASTQAGRIFAFRWLLTVLVLFYLLVVSTRCVASENDTDSLSALEKLRWSTDSPGPRRFVSIHGRRAAIFGYPQGYTADYLADGLEVWTYPVQILRSYRVAFRTEGATTAIDGQTILRRIIYSPEAVTRVYAGPDFVVREKLFVPVEEPGAIIAYEVDGARPIDIEIRFIPVLDVMWPASIGGQETAWNAAASAYVLREPTHRFMASIGSPDIVAHDETPNIGQQVSELPGLAFTIRAGGGHRHVRVVIAGSVGGQDLNKTAKALLEDAETLQKGALKNYVELLSHSLQIETPDAETNRALGWAEVAVDQAWVCNPDLGCGLVAGYGPSRKARRPQYDWFFAGDGMVALESLLATGQFERAREELEFILKFQDPQNGMIWHELSQSAALLDWRKYPYMFGHVNLTFEFIDAVASYFARTGDRNFLKEHWSEVQSAYNYCRALIDGEDGLPRIPSDKQGGWEQDPLTDELALSISWAKAAKAYADLAGVVGESKLVEAATAASDRAIRAIHERYWDKQHHAWISGFTRSGTRFTGRGIGPTEINGKYLISQAEVDELLDGSATADFQTDWGTRGSAASSANYDPNSYSRGSVWATGTARAAAEYWREHRPNTACPIWSALVPWSSLDSLGHMHEVLAADFYHEEVESVPEQTWSSATFLSSAISGLLGLEVDAPDNRLTFAPHLPANWTFTNLSGIRIGRSDIDIRMTQSLSDVRLQMENRGDPVEIVFNPEIPMGATLGEAHFGRRVVAEQLEEHPQDTHARVQFVLPHGGSELTITYSGGISLVTDPSTLLIGNRSKAIKITGTTLTNQSYAVDFESVRSVQAGFDLRSKLSIKQVEGGRIAETSPGWYRVIVPPDHADKTDAYKHGQVIVTFAR